MRSRGARNVRGTSRGAASACRLNSGHKLQRASPKRIARRRGARAIE